MLQQWPPLANRFLRKREEDYVSALCLSTGLGLSIAGLVALCLLGISNPLMHVPCIVHSALCTLSLVVAVLYYSLWGTWVRRRLRKPLHGLVISCTTSAAIVDFFTLDSPSIFSIIGSFVIGFLALQFIWNRLIRDSQEHDRNEFWLHSLIVVASLLAGAQAAMSWTDLIPIALFTIGSIAYAISYRPWAHVVWHIFAIAAAIAHYSVMWQSLT